jgi:hypothetical protein
MFVDWNEVNKSLVPIKNYEELLQRFRVSFSYSFVREIFNFTMPELVTYTRLSVGADPRGRYNDYAEKLVQTLTEFHQAGVKNLLDLISRVETPAIMEQFAEQNKIYASEIVAVLKYLIYWFIPGEKYLSGLVRDDQPVIDAVKILSGSGIRTNLEILQKGRNANGRKALAESSGLPDSMIVALVNRADFSRMPWSSKATISNIMGAGYTSLAKLAHADPEQLYTDFFSYGKSIGKNLKLGNEIENSYRIAKILPVILQEK